MKKIAYRLLSAVLLFSLLLCFAACNKQDPSSPESLAGTYYLSSITYSDGSSLSGDALRTEFEDGWGMALTDNYVELRTDGTGTVCIYGFPQEIAYADGYFWYPEFLMDEIYVEDEVIIEEVVTEDGEVMEIIVPVETTEPAETTIPEELKNPFTVSGNKITMDPEGLGETMTFTKP